MSWYKEINKIAGESVSLPDAHMSPSDIADTVRLNKWTTDSYQGLRDVPTSQGLGINPNLPKAEDEEYGKKVNACGEEPGLKGGCGLDLSEYGEFYNYSVQIGDEKYQAYKCKNCGHSLKPFHIEYTKKPNKNKKPPRKRVKRLNSGRVVARNVKAQTYGPQPGGRPNNTWSGGTYNNPANAPWGRLDVSEDARIIPWSKVEKDFNSEYNTREQKGRPKQKVIKIKDKDGKDKYVKVRFFGGTDGVTPANVYKMRGKIKQQPRFNPAKGKNKNDGHGAWPHNRDGNKGWYQSPQSNDMDTDLRERVIPWDRYTKERNNFLLTLTKPY